MKIRLTVLIAIFLITSGCVQNSQLKKDAFAKPMKMAVVTVSGTVYERWAGTEDEQKQILKEVTDTTLKELNKSRHIQLVSHSHIIADPHYKAIKAYEKSADYLPAPGYKVFDPSKERENLKGIANDLHVDGLLYVWVQYGGYDRGLLGISPVMVIYLRATDVNGEVLWVDMANRYDGGHVGMAKAITNELVDQLDKNLASK